jgi:hypothetical protein
MLQSAVLKISNDRLGRRATAACALAVALLVCAVAALPAASQNLASLDAQKAVEAMRDAGVSKPGARDLVRAAERGSERAKTLQRRIVAGERSAFGIPGHSRGATRVIQKTHHRTTARRCTAEIMRDNGMAPAAARDLVRAAERGSERAKTLQRRIVAGERSAFSIPGE